MKIHAKFLLTIVVAFELFSFKVSIAQVSKAVFFSKTMTAGTTAVLDTFFVSRPTATRGVAFDTVRAINVGSWNVYGGEAFLFVRLISGTAFADSVYVEAKNTDNAGRIVDNDSTYAFGGPSTQTSLVVDKPKGGPLSGLDVGTPGLALIVTLDTAGTFRFEFTVVFRSNVMYERR